MPMPGSPEKGNLYVTMKVRIPDFTDADLGKIEDFFNKMQGE